jgi:hypothetical protein
LEQALDRTAKADNRLKVDSPMAGVKPQTEWLATTPEPPIALTMLPAEQE